MTLRETASNGIERLDTAREHDAQVYAEYHDDPY
jgi:hypothetical protein